MKKFILLGLFLGVGCARSTFFGAVNSGPVVSRAQGNILCALTTGLDNVKAVSGQDTNCICVSFGHPNGSLVMPAVNSGLAATMASVLLVEDQACDKSVSDDALEPKEGTATAPTQK